MREDIERQIEDAGVRLAKAYYNGDEYEIKMARAHLKSLQILLQAF